MSLRTPSRRNWLHAAGAAVLLAWPLGCLSPTLPLPPPSRPDVSPPDGSGVATITGVVPGGTTAIAQNLQSGRLVGQETDSGGNYELELEAAIGDQVAVWYRDGLTDSAAVQVTVPAESSDLGPLESPGEIGPGGASGTDN